ncbi:MAG: hypothetical protein M0P69_09795 [Bacteroidales bacterium]|nr:hypothetical protein [Bacteroidales bacterium]
MMQDITEGKKNAKYYTRLFEKAFAYGQPRFDDYAELVAFYELTQAELPQYQVEKPWVHNINAPYATDAINLRVASLQASDYLGELEPLSPDDEETIQRLNWAYHALWKEMNMDKHVNDSILRSAVMREAYTHVVYDDKVVGGTNRRRHGALDAYFIDPASVLIDPSARGLKEADYVIVTERITKKQVKNRYPEFDFEAMKGSSKSPMERGEIFYGTDFSTEQDDNVMTKMTFYEREEDGIYKAVMVENQLVKSPELMEVSVYPIAQLRWQKKLKSPYGVSLMDMILPLQKTVNEVESAVANTALQFSSPSYVLSGDSGINPEDLALMGGTPGAVFVSEQGIDINNVVAPLMRDRKIDAAMISVKQEHERTIYKLAGINEQFLGSFGTAGNTASGAADAMNRAKIIENRFLVNLEEYIEDLTEIVVEFITKVFGGETMYVRSEKKSDGSFDFQELEVPEVENAQYTFSIHMNVKTQYSKEQERALLKELYQFQLQYDAPVKALSFLDVLKTYDVPNIQELVERLQRMTNMDAEQRAELAVMLVNAAAELGIDEGALKQALVEIILALPETPTVDALLEELEKTKAAEEEKGAMVEQVMNNQMMDQQMQMAEAAQQGPTGDEVFEMPEGAQMMPTGDETFDMGA